MFRMEADVHARLVEICQRWKVVELALFGSGLGEDFGPESDLDLLVTFRPDAHWTLLDHIGMQQELESLFGREVDLLSRSAVEKSRNPIRKASILGTARRLYAA